MTVAVRSKADHYYQSADKCCKGGDGLLWLMGFGLTEEAERRMHPSSNGHVTSKVDRSMKSYLFPIFYVDRCSAGHTRT